MDDVCSLPKLRIIADRYGNVNVVVGVKGTEEWSIRCAGTAAMYIGRLTEVDRIFLGVRHLQIWSSEHPPMTRRSSSV